MWVRSSDLRHFRFFRAQKLRKWRTFFLDDQLLDRCGKWLPPAKIAEPSCIVQVPCLDLRSRVILPYHPCLVGLARLVRDVCVRWQKVLEEDLGRFSGLMWFGGQDQPH